MGSNFGHSSTMSDIFLGSRTNHETLKSVKNENESSYNRNRNKKVHIRGYSSECAEITALSRRQKYSLHLDRVQSLKINVEKPKESSRAETRNRCETVGQKHQPKAKFDKLADLVKSAKSFVDYQERQKPRILKMKKE